MNSKLRAVIDQEILRVTQVDASHGITHIKRVWNNVKKIVQHLEEEVDLEVLEIATSLHDAVSLPKNHPERHLSSKYSAQRAQEILTSTSYPEDKIREVMHAIEAHSFSRGLAPETLEAKVLQDADRIDALGAIGIARCFYVTGSMKRELYSEEDPMAQNRELNDQQFAVDHFYKKLFRLPETMQTEAGRTVALEKVAYMREFLQVLNEEIS